METFGPGSEPVSAEMRTSGDGDGDGRDRDTWDWDTMEFLLATKLQTLRIQA